MPPRPNRPPSRAERLGVALDEKAANALDRKTVLGPRHPVLRTCCLEWSGALLGGYGRLTLSGVGVYTHRLSVALVNQRWPRDQVMHLCDNRKCVNPFHLREASPAENTHDMIAKGRQRCLKGRPSVQRKLSDADVAHIRKLLATHPTLRPRALRLQNQIAEHYGVHPTIISGIKTGKRYTVKAGEAAPTEPKTKRRAKLTKRQAAEVKWLAQAPKSERPDGLKTQVAIAERYGVSKALVRLIRKGILHTDVQPLPPTGQVHNHHGSMHP